MDDLVIRPSDGRMIANISDLVEYDAAVSDLLEAGDSLRIAVGLFEKFPNLDDVPFSLSPRRAAYEAAAARVRTLQNHDEVK